MSKRQNTAEAIEAALEEADIDIEELVGRVENLPDDMSKRALLSGAAAGAGGASLLSAMTGTAEAGTNQVGTLGTDNNRLDAEIEDLDLTDQSSTPAGPGSGQVRMYFKNGSPYYKPAGGSETQLGGSGSGGGDLATVTVASSSSSTSADYTADGTNDQTTINNAISSLPSDGGTVELTEGRFTLGGAITDQGKTNVVLRGQGRATELFMAGSTQANVIEIVNTTGWTVRELKINGNEANQSDGGTRFNQCGILVECSKDVWIYENDLRNFVYTGVRCLADGNTGDGTMRNVVVENNYLENTRVGATDTVSDLISQTGRNDGVTYNFRAISNTMVDSGHISLETTKEIHGLVVADNYSEGHELEAYNVHNGKASDDDAAVIVANNVARNSSTNAICDYTASVEGAIYTGNVSANCAGPGFIIARNDEANNVQVVGNTIVGSGSHGIEHGTSSPNPNAAPNAMISNNTIIGAAGDGIRVSSAANSDNPTITNNTLVNITGSPLNIDSGVSGVIEQLNNYSGAGTYEYVSDGDGVERDIYVIASGASDPASATADDLIFEKQ